MVSQGRAPWHKIDLRAMGYLPIFVEVGGRPCLVVGGGEVAERKVRSLLEANADVSVVSPELTPALFQLSATGRIRYHARAYRRGDMRDHLLIFAATADRRLHRALADEARELGVLINVADEPELCSFIAPAVLKRGDLHIAISTGGASPAMARRLRAELEELIGHEYELLLRVLRAVRIRLQADEPDGAARARMMGALAASELPTLIRRADFISIDRLLAEHLGPLFTLEALGFKSLGQRAAIAEGGAGSR